MNRFHLKKGVKFSVFIARLLLVFTCVCGGGGGLMSCFVETQDPRALTVHHYHHQIWRIPPNVAIDDLAGSGGDQAGQSNKNTNHPLHRHSTYDKSAMAIGVTSEVAFVGHARGCLADGLVHSGHHDPIEPEP